MQATASEDLPALLDCIGTGICVGECDGDTLCVGPAFFDVIGTTVQLDVNVCIPEDIIVQELE